MNTAESLNLKELYRDEDLGLAVLHMVGEKFVIHSELKPKALQTKEGLQRVQEISTMIDEAFKKRGVDKIYTFAETDEQYRFNHFLGWEPTGKEMELSTGDTRHFYEFQKVLN